MSFVINPDNTPTFVNGVRVGNVGIDYTSAPSNYGTIRYNLDLNRFEGLHRTTGPTYEGSSTSNLNSYWRTFGPELASTTVAGVAKIGTNLTINSTTGVLSSIATGESRIYQGVITISDNDWGADYTSINTAITNALGNPPGYSDGSITTDYGAPSLTNKYILLVGPGVYNERVNLPNYVILRGEGIDKTFLKQDNGGSSVVNSALITLGNNTSLENLTLEMNGNGEAYGTAVYSIGNSDVSISDIKITDSGGTTSTASYGIYLGDNSGHSIKNTTIILDKASVSSYGAYISNTSLDYKNNKTTITAPSTNNYGLYINDITGGLNDIVGADIEISGASNNYGIYHNDADATIRYSKIVADGDVDNSTDIAYGIICNSSSASGTITSDKLQFIHNSTNGVKDIIYLTDTTSDNFIATGFKANMRIVVSNASNGTNNNYFTIDKVTTDTITLSEGDRLTNEAIGTSITIKQLYTITCEYNTVKATSNGSALSNSVAVLSSSGNFDINLQSTKLIGGIPSLNSSRFILNTPRIITVAPQGADFYLLSEAISSIVDNDSERRYLIKVKGGNYVETGQITCKQYVSIEGDGAETTTLTFDVASGTLSLASAITLASNMDISGLRIVNTTASLTSTSIGFYISSKQDLNIHNCEVSLTGTAQTKYGIYSTSGNYKTVGNILTITAGASSANNYGIYNTGSTHTSVRDTITIAGSSSTLNVAHSAQDTTLAILEPVVSVSGSTTANKGVSVSSSGTQDYLVRINQGEVITSGTGNNSLVIEDDNYTMIAVGTRLGGDVSFTDTNTDTTLKCIGCYSVTGTTSLEYTSINQHGVNEGSDDNLTLGDGAGSSSSTGTQNTFLGTNAGNAITSGNRNTFVGANTGKVNTIGDDNTFVGSGAGISVSIGDFNTLLGSNAGGYLSTGVQNLVAGRNAGRSLQNANYNTMLGEAAGYTTTSGSQNVMVGEGAGFSNTIGARNTYVGGGDSSNVGAGYANTEGNDNVALGHQALKTNISADDNTAIGKKAIYSTVGADNTAVGSDAGYYQTTGTQNTFLGRQAGYGNSGGATGSGNTVMGSNAGVSLTSGSYNVLSGHNAGYSITTGSRIVAIGAPSTTAGTDAAGYGLTEATDTILIGSKAGKAITTPSNNIMVGSNAGSTLTTGADNTAIGTDAMANNVTGADCISIGRKAGYSYKLSGAVMVGNYAGESATGNKSTFIGTYAGQNVTGQHNTYVGYEAGRAFNAAGTGANNVAIGAYVAKKINGGNRNIIVGSGDTASGEAAAAQLNDGDDNIIFGYKTGKSLVNGNENILIGTRAGETMTGSLGSIAIGYEAGLKTKGNYNTFIGYKSGYKQDTTGGGVDKNIMIGYQSGYNNNTGGDIIAIGTDAGYTGSTAAKNISIGTEAGYNMTGSDNISLGYNAGKATSTGTNNTFIGYKSGGYGSNGSGMIGVFNLCLGDETGYSMVGASRNVMIGNKAGRDITAGAKNVLIGNHAGYATTASRNIFIGMTDNDSYGVGHNSTGAENIAIGSNVAVRSGSGEKNIIMG